MSENKDMLNESELNRVAGGTDDMNSRSFPIGTKVSQINFPADYRGSNNGVISEYLPDGRYRVMWDNGYDGDTYDERVMKSMVMAWDIMYG